MARLANRLLEADPHFMGLLAWVTPSRRTLLSALVLLALGAAMSLVHPLLAGRLTSAIVGESAAQAGQLWQLGLLWLLLLLAQAILQFRTALVLGQAGEDAISALRERVYEHMQALPLSYHQSIAPGDELSLLANDAEQLSYLMTETLIPLLPALLTFCGAFALLCWFAPLVGVLAALLIPAYFLLMKLLGRRLRPLALRWTRAYAAMFAVAEENLKLLPVLKSFARESHEAARFNEANEALRQLGREQVAVDSAMSPAAALAAGLGMLLLLALAVALQQQGALSAAGLVMVVLYARMLVAPVSLCASAYSQLQRARGAAQRLGEFFQVAGEPVADGGVAAPAQAAAIEFRDVSFHYTADRPVLRELSLRVEPGETVAITGPNGCGKSTLVYLLQRFADPTGGAIYLDGKNIRDYGLHSLRRHVGVVSQQTLLLNDTISANIAYAAPAASSEQVRRAAQLAQVDGFAGDFPQGMDTVIGDQGVRLSGGQRQRLALARALLKDAPLLILDEATSMFDHAAEEEFVVLAEQMLAGRTTLIISHRVASLALAERHIALPELQLVDS